MSIDKEYIDFVNSETALPASAEKDILRTQLALLKPAKSIWIASSIQLLSCLLTLLFCPQFGYGAVIWGKEFTHHILHHSPLLCGAYCGFVYLGMSSLVTGLVMPRPSLLVLNELKVVRVSVAMAMIMAIIAVSKVSSTFTYESLTYLVAWFGAGLLSFTMMHTCTRVLRTRYLQY